MYLHLSAITSIGGLPLFNRTFDCTGKPEKISFVNLSTLNAISVFCSTNQAKLYSATTENCKFYWKSTDSITLIVVLKQSGQTSPAKASRVSFADESFENLLTLVYNLLLMFCTKEQLINEHLEKVKSKIRACYFAIDYIIESFLCKSSFTLQTNCLEYKLGSYKCAQLSKDLINSLSGAVDSSFVCLSVDLKIVNCTRSYGEKLLSSIDGQLISILMQAKQSKEDGDLTEIEIFLPQHCPELTSRLIFAKLSERCSVTILCGDKPSLDWLHHELIEPLKRHPQNLQLFNELETKSLVQSEHILDDRVINFVYFDFKDRMYFKNGVFCKEKIASLITFLQTVDLDGEDVEQAVMYSNCKLFVIHRKSDACLMLVMFPKSLNLNDLKKSGLKTYNEVLKIRKKNFSPTKP